MNIHLVSPVSKLSVYLVFTILSSSVISGVARAELPEPSVSPLTFKLFTWRGESLTEDEEQSPQSLYFQRQDGEGKYESLLRNDGSALSSEYKTSVASKLILFKKTSTPAGVDLFSPIASTSDVEEGKAVLQPLTFVDQKYSMLAVNTSLEVFPENVCLLINHSDQPLRIQINQVEVKVEAKAVELIPFIFSKKKTLRIVVSQADEPFKKLSVMTVGGRKGQRIIGFFYTFKGRGRLLLERGVDDQSVKIITEK